MTHNSEQHFYEGPRARLQELGFAVRVFAEFIRGFRALHFAGRRASLKVADGGIAEWTGGALERFLLEFDGR